MSIIVLCLYSCLFYSAKDMLLTASKDGTIKVWNGMAFTEMAEIIAHTEAITGKCHLFIYISSSK